MLQKVKGLSVQSESRNGRKALLLESMEVSPISGHTPRDTPNPVQLSRHCSELGVVTSRGFF